MRKLLVIVTLSLGTLAWAQLAGNNMISSDQPLSGGGSYSQIVAAQAEQNVLVNAAIAPSHSEFVQSENLNAEPGSMAASEAAQGGSWYNQKVAQQAELNSRILKAETSNKF